MLQIKEICKEYRTGSLVQKALDKVSLNLRDNEFVAILGPSGSGKTTLLNIIGGLDQADAGEIIINGKSSADFKQSDYDSYRNTYVGFIFQEFNLMEEYQIETSVLLEMAGWEKQLRSLEYLESKGFLK